MAWNKPSTENQQKKPRAKAPSAKRGVIAGAVVVVALGALCLYLFSNGEATSSSLQKKSHGLIREATPAPAPKSAAQLEKEAHPGMVKVRGKWYPEYNKKGGRIWITAYDVRYHTPVVYTNDSNVANEPAACKIFTNRADKDIAHLLTCEAGAVVIGDWDYGAAFTRDFLESLKTPIIPTSDDDEWTAEVKRAVNQTKIDLKARYDAGEDIAKIMNDSRKELQHLGVYKMQLEETVREAVREAKYNPESAKELYDSANRMLAEKGIKDGFELPNFLACRLKIEASKNQNKTQESEDE